MELQESVMDLGEFRLNYHELGSGTPLLMIHGSEPNEDWRVWEPLLSMSDSHRLIIPDLVGHGGSSRPDNVPNHRVQGNVMGELLEKLSISKADVIGGGWGGQVALELAMGSQGRIGALVLIASSYDVDQVKGLQKLRRPTLI